MGVLLLHLVFRENNRYFIKAERSVLILDCTLV